MLFSTDNSSFLDFPVIDNPGDNTGKKVFEKVTKDNNTKI
jgi:hypothetical protein